MLKLAWFKINFFVKKFMIITVLLFVFTALMMPVVFASGEDTTLPGTLLIPAENETFGAIYEEQPVNIYTPLTRSALPSYVNLTTDEETKDYFPPIRSQYGGSCAAWASTYYQFTYEVARLNDWDVSNDDSKVFSPKYVWNYLNEGENLGVSRAACFRFLEKQGSLRWSEFPQNSLSFDWYEGKSNTETTNALCQSLKTRIVNSSSGFKNFNNSTDTATITSNTDSDLDGIKQLLSEGHVLTIDTFVCNWQIDFLSDGRSVILFGYEGYTRDENGEIKKDKEGNPSPTGHALTIVGYDDNIEYDLNQNGTIEAFEKGAFLIANSWGTQATNHNNGYIWVMYDALNNVSNVPLFNQFSGNINENTGPRKGFICDNSFYCMEVANYTPQRMAEVTIQQKYRSDITVSLSTSDYVSSAKTTQTTFLNQLGGAKSFDGGNNGYQTRTFVFDCADLYDANNKIYWVNITDNDESNSADTTVTKIRWVNANGTVLKEIGQQNALMGETDSYYYGIPVTSISLNKTSSTLYKGDTEQLTATISPSKATQKTLTWKSSNTSVVKVSSSGLVTYVGTGTATVTATTTDGSNLSASCTYNISDDYQDVYNKAYRVTLHSKTSGSIEASGDVDFFKFTPTTTGTYLFYTTGSTDTVGYLYNSSQSQLTYNDDASISGNNFAVKYTLTANQTYYIKVYAYSTKTGAYTLNISKDFYSASLADTNQDARRVQMQAEAASILTTLKVKIGTNTYTLTKPTSGTLDTTINGARFKVTFTSANGGLSTIWVINAKIPATATGTTDTVSFTFSKGKITDINSPDLTGLVAYKSSIKTGIDARATNNLQLLVNSMTSTGYTLTVRNWDDSLVNVTSTTKAATGMKIIKKDSSGRIVEIYYLVLFGDITGTGVVNIGDGAINSSDALLLCRTAWN